MNLEREKLASIVSKNLKKYRKEKNLSQLKVAAKAGVHFTYYSQVERKLRPDISVRLLLRIADALDITLNDLVYDWDGDFIDSP